MLNQQYKDAQQQTTILDEALEKDKGKIKELENKLDTNKKTLTSNKKEINAYLTKLSERNKEIEEKDEKLKELKEEKKALESIYPSNLKNTISKKTISKRRCMN